MSSSDDAFFKKTDASSDRSTTESDIDSPRILFNENDDKYTDEDLRHHTFNRIELESINHNNFERIFTLRKARYFPNDKGTEVLADYVLCQQEGYSSTPSSDVDSSSDSSSDSSENNSNKDNIPNN